MMRGDRSLSLAVVALGVLFAVVKPVFAQSGENVAVVINENSEASQQIGEYYVRRRAVPPANVIRVRTSTQEQIDPAAYVSSIELPILSALRRGALQDRVLYIVLTKGVPLRINGTPGAQGTGSSVDSELTLLYRRSLGIGTDVRGGVPNPYYVGAKPTSEAKPFTRRDHDIYLVTRLDAFTVEEAMALVDRAVSPSTNGQIVLDLRDKLGDRKGEDWLETAAARLKTRGFEERVVLESTAAPARDLKSVLGYYSWGSTDPRNRVRKFNLGFEPGAIAGMFVSLDARTFQEPPADWQPTETADKSKWFGGAAQSLVGDLIREGVTGVSGHVAEPFLEAAVRPEVLFPAYVSGLNLAEAFYAAMPSLSWQNVVIGDPLCAPFRKHTLTKAEIGDETDRDTRLPRFYSERRVAQLGRVVRGVENRALVLLARAEGLLLRGDSTAARTAFEEAARVAPRSSYVQLQLALDYERDQSHDRAMEVYRRVIALEPRNGVALNNLAYALAVRENKPAEGLEFAKRAVTIGPRNAAYLDTLAWIEYLLGDTASAAKRIALAIQSAPQDADVRLHAAAINAAAGARAVAEAELNAALKLRPALESSAEVKRIRDQLQKLSSP